jgi:hypothetical protein
MEKIIEIIIANLDGKQGKLFNLYSNNFHIY